MSVLAVCGGCSRSPAPLGHQVAAQPGVPPRLDSTSRKPSAATDTTGAFNPTGYYFPERELLFDHWKLGWIEMGARMAIRFDSLQDRPNGSVGPEFSCSGSANRDTVSLSCPHTSIGNVTVEGHFLDKRGNFWNLPDVTPNKSIVVHATITSANKGKVVSQEVNFTYWEGD